MTQALRCGVTMAEFYDMTPRETYQVIEAANWRQQQLEARQATFSWLTVALIRTRRLPSLASFKSSMTPARPLKGQELAERRREFKEIATPEKIGRINRMMQKLGNKIKGNK